MKLTIIGGGAAGFFCAVNAARMNPRLEVCILEKSNKLLSKVKVSGGGRCNVTHACFSIPEMIKNYPRGNAFLKKAFHHFFTTDTVEWFATRGVELKTEKDGRMFPLSNSSQSIIDCLFTEAAKYHVDIQMNSDVVAVEKSNSAWLITLRSGQKIPTDMICFAAGGSAKSAHYDGLRSLGHSIATPVSSLFTFNIPGNAITALSGITVEHVTVKIAGDKNVQHGPLLITHWGISGPAVLKTSSYAAELLASKDYNFTTIINWLPQFNEITVKEKLLQFRGESGGRKIGPANFFSIPARLWEHLLAASGISTDTRFADVAAKSQNLLAKNLCAHELHVSGKTTFKEEFVTAGGVGLSEVDVNTMQSKLQPGLFFAGEILNVDGVTGGFNFQHAWTSGWVAARAAAEVSLSN